MENTEQKDTSVTTHGSKESNTPGPVQENISNGVANEDHNADSHTAHLEQKPTTDAPKVSEDRKKPHSHLRNVLSTVGIFLLAPLLAIFLTAFVFQSYEVDGVSMETTLQNQDRLIVYKLPKTIASIQNKTYIPKRGEIIVFERLGSEGFVSGEDKQLIKRVIGVPGDRVVIKNNKVTVYNSENPKGFDPDKETNHLDPGENTEGNVDIELEKDELFVLGDNRSNSLDSRVFGPLNAEHITGSLVLRIYPFHKFQVY